LWQIFDPNDPLSMTLVLAVDSSTDNQLVQRVGKPRWLRTSSRNGQDIESKAHTMSTLRRSEGCFLKCSSLDKSKIILDESALDERALTSVHQLS
jgi:hypothetical protein